MANTVSPEGTDAWRERLERRAGELRAEVRGAELSGVQPRDATPPEVSDQKDRAAEMEAGRVQQAEQQRDIDELAQVEAALARLDAGSFGICADCGEPIGAARLAVMPSAARCAACQVASESHRGAAARHG